MPIVGIFLILIFLVVFIFILIFNTLIGKKNALANSFSAVDAQLKRRFDLIPNLVSSVKVFMTHEKDIFEKLAILRTKALETNTLPEKLELNKEISSYLKSLMINVENYPELKSNTQFLELQKNLSRIEEEISAARRAYNATVTEYNNALEMFPSNIVASLMRLPHAEVIEASEHERKNVNVAELFK